MSQISQNESEPLRLPFRLVWNDDERRPRAPIRLIAGILVVLVFANTGRTIQPSILTGDGPLTEVVNTMVGGIPQAAGIVLGVILVALILDRRELTDLGLNFKRDGWRRFAGGLVLGLGITTLSLVAGVAVGFYEITGIQLTGGPAVWVLLVIGTALSQLLIVIAEELFVRGYIITNAAEGLDGISSIPQSVAVSVAILISSLFFYFTHSVRGGIFGIMAGGLAILLGVAYVLSGDLSVPIGIHFGVNFAGMIGGSAPQQATLMQITSPTTVAESLVLPEGAVALRLLGAIVGIGLLFWWYRRANGYVRPLPSIACPTLRRDCDNDTSTENP